MSGAGKSKNGAILGRGMRTKVGKNHLCHMPEGLKCLEIGEKILKNEKRLVWSNV